MRPAIALMLSQKTVVPVVNDTIAFDAAVAATGSGYSSGSFTATLAHTCTGANRLLTVFVRCGTDVVTSVTYNSVALTLAHKNSTGGYLYTYYLIAPATGANNVVVNKSDFSSIWLAGASYTGCKQTGQGGTFSDFTDSVTDTAPALTTPSDKCWVVGGDWTQTDQQTPYAPTVRRCIHSAGLGNGLLQLNDSNAAKTPAGSQALSFRGSIPTETHNGTLLAIVPSG